MAPQKDVIILFEKDRSMKNRYIILLITPLFAIVTLGANVDALPPPPPPPKCDQASPPPVDPRSELQSKEIFIEKPKTEDGPEGQKATYRLRTIYFAYGMSNLDPFCCDGNSFNECVAGMAYLTHDLPEVVRSLYGIASKGANIRINISGYRSQHKSGGEKGNNNKETCRSDGDSDYAAGRAEYVKTILLRMFDNTGDAAINRWLNSGTVNSTGSGIYSLSGNPSSTTAQRVEIEVVVIGKGAIADVNQIKVPLHPNK